MTWTLQAAAENVGVAPVEQIQSSIRLLQRYTVRDSIYRGQSYSQQLYDSDSAIQYAIQYPLSIPFLEKRKEKRKGKKKGKEKKKAVTVTSL